MRCEWIWGCLGNGEKREGMRRSYWGRRQGISRIWLGFGPLRALWNAFVQNCGRRLESRLDRSG